MSRFSLIFFAALTLIGVTSPTGTSAFADILYAQYYPPPGYGYPPPSSPPPCSAVTPGPLQGAARGAAGGARRFLATLGAAPQSEPALAVSAAPYVGVRPEVRAPVTSATRIADHRTGGT